MNDDADEASRDVEAWLKCKYMREHLGEEYGGVVTSATSFGIFVTLDAMYVEGLVHITELGGEYFRFDEMRQELRGERTGIRYSIGSRVRVQVSRVDLDGRKIDFRLIREGEELVPRAMKDKGFQREDHGRRKDDSPLDSSGDKHTKRKISEPLARAPKPAARKHGVKAVAAKNGKGRKSRR